jgi:hypothetical protein
VTRQRAGLGPYYDRLVTLANEGDRRRSAASIHRALVREFASVLDLPTERTTRNWVDEARAPDASGRWELRPEAGPEARLVLEVLEAFAALGGRTPLYLTNDAARWIVTIREAAPTLGAMSACVLAGLYRSRLAHGAPTADLDYFLALAPWRGGNARWAYEQAVKRGFTARVSIAAKSANDEALDLCRKTRDERLRAGFDVDDEDCGDG